MIDDRAIDEAGRRLAASASSPAKVILFGSRARGEGDAGSDVDFLVIEENVESKVDEMVRLRDALAEFTVPVDVVVVSQAEMERARERPGSLVRRALSEGRVLVEP